MKRQVLAIAVGSLFALPVFADLGSGVKRSEIQPGVAVTTPLYVAPKTREDVRNELLDAQNADQIVVNAELGVTAEQYAAIHADAAKTRDEVVSEATQAHDSGDYIVNAELGMTENQML